MTGNGKFIPHIIIYIWYTGGWCKWHCFTHIKWYTKKPLVTFLQRTDEAFLAPPAGCKWSSSSGNGTGYECQAEIWRSGPGDIWWHEKSWTYCVHRIYEPHALNVIYTLLERHLCLFGDGYIYIYIYSYMYSSLQIFTCNHQWPYIYISQSPQNMALYGTVAPF